MPKLSIYKFDSDILNWRTCWEQFQASIHNSDQLSDAENLAYLKDSLKDGPAEHVIQGQAPTAGTYDETIECLLNWYNQPCLINQAHVRSILDVQSLKEDNGKELRHFDDVLLQHYRALKALDEDNFETLLIPIVELKMDPTTC